MNWLKASSIGLLFLFAVNLQAEENYVVPPMVAIPAGKFIMGSEKKAAWHLLYSPEHAVNIKAFRLSKYELTVREFRKFVEDTNFKTKSECWRHKQGTREIESVAGSWDLPKYAPSDFHPVMCVGMDDALAYMAWLSKKTGNTFRFASEAEWEYAARAGSKDDYFFGNDPKKLCKYGNVLDQSGERAFERDVGLDWTGVNCDDKAEYTSIVGMYKPNAFGLFDMIGNVGELLKDCEHFDFKGAPADGSAWTTDCAVSQVTHEGKVYTMGPMFIHRGGSYGSDGVASRIFVRGHTGDNNSSSLGEGIRLAQDSVEEKAPAIHLENTNSFLQELSVAQKKSRNP
jgi:formylglycine-generating enzyme required for sulfatase activity